MSGGKMGEKKQALDKEFGEERRFYAALKDGFSGGDNLAED